MNMAEVTGYYKDNLLKSLKSYISNKATSMSCKDIMDPDLKDVGISIVGKYFTVDMASPFVEGDVTKLRTLVLYDNTAIKRYGSVGAVKTRINHLFSAANTAYRDSTLNLQVTPVGYKLYTKSDSKDLMNALVLIGKDSDFVYMDMVGQRPNNSRNKNKAHTVMLMKGKSENYGLCGLGINLEIRDF